MRPRQISVTVFLDDVELEVRGKFWPADPGRTYGPPERCYPPEPADLSITEIRNTSGENVMFGLTDAELERVADLAMEEAEEMLSDWDERE